ncbi:MAG: thiamine ABC transporter substrate-binding protein [Anaerolineae bacterium]|nr:thiamine ABC transporter substrate-binding protein [Anaerolineae bacterium]
MKKTLFAVLIVIVTLLAAGCAPAAAEQPAELVVMTHDSFAVSESVITAFEAAHQVTVTFIKSGDTGAALNRAVLAKDAPIADVFYGVDNTFLSRALEAGIFEPYASPLLAQVPDAFELSPGNEALPVNYGDVCINYDKAWFAAQGLPVPATLADLADPAYAGLLAVQNPATSSPGLAFLLATIAEYGEDGYLAYWESLRANGVVVSNDWESAYYGNFTPYGGGQPLVVSYASSPAAEVIFAAEPLDEAPTGSIIGPNTCFRQVEFVGILRGTQQRALAEQFVDFLLDVAFQQDLPLQMFVYPVNTQAVLPEAFAQWAESAPAPALLDPALIAENRERWIQAWDQAVLR